MLTEKLLRSAQNTIKIQFMDIQSKKERALYFEVACTIHYNQSLNSKNLDAGLTGHYLVTVSDQTHGHLLYDDQSVYLTDPTSFHGAHLGYVLKKIPPEEAFRRIDEAQAQQSTNTIEEDTRSTAASDDEDYHPSARSRLLDIAGTALI